MSKAKSSVVVIGGGGAGAPLARALAQQLPDVNVTLIEAREYYLHYPGALRMLVTSEGKLEDKVLIPYDRLFANTTGNLVHASVTTIVRNKNEKGGHVTVDSGQQITYDALVIASGSVWEGPLVLPPTKSAAVEHVREWRKNIKSANGVAIVGGGAVGAELAGEIRDIYPEKKITIIQRGDHLLVSRYPAKYRTDVDKRWNQRNIALVLNDEINEIPPYPAGGVTTRKGTIVEADLVIPTRGGHPNTAFVSTLGPGLLNKEGYIKVEPTLQLQGIPGVFALGDVLDWKEVKQVAKCPGHVTVAVANVKSFLQDKALTSVYKGMFELIVVTNGANGGAAYIDQLWGLCFGNSFSKMIKSKDLFIAQTSKALGY
ncbi:hypothetical protein DFH07DRAFT_793316 [Mycena maculata]|uniref:FAD/NAD(P)-binding domain-containing protein n=1 Tax=Mycena maculata TaxID=230809 RepID=A0AAD7K8S6_9AGAR|nr:hypothetical protein DFH07DRAFT_793316 [Mycena maculata]